MMTMILPLAFVFALRLLVARKPPVPRSFTISDRIGGGLAIARLAIKATLSVGLTAIAGYVILSGKYDDHQQNFAYNVIGSIVGFWLRNDHAV